MEQDMALLKEFQELPIPECKTVLELHPLPGKYINLEYSLPNGEKVKLWKDEEICWGTQICRGEGKKCYGLAANASYLLVCAYGDNGADPEIILYQKRKGLL